MERRASNSNNMENCNHPRVRVLSHEEDADFVECLECGEVFDPQEFDDMAIEERTQQEAKDAES